ncbi:hypothetical protein V8G54_017291 [Vigna mungo]|uniref:Uncharacterized protein n=1 Tax=Vigna mungo TaxID=3915 RepID=A0AAQ3NMQ8_VIGMU
MSSNPNVTGTVISSKSPNSRSTLLLLPSSSVQTPQLLTLQSTTALTFSFSDCSTQLSSAAIATTASAATRRISFAFVDAGKGSRQAESAKLRQADFPRSARAATSCARAAISGVGYVPSQILVDLSLGTRTSQTHLLFFLCRTPR